MEPSFPSEAELCKGTYYLKNIVLGSNDLKIMPVIQNKIVENLDNSMLFTHGLESDKTKGLENSEDIQLLTKETTVAEQKQKPQMVKSSQILGEGFANTLEKHLDKIEMHSRRAEVLKIMENHRDSNKPKGRAKGVLRGKGATKIPVTDQEKQRNGTFLPSLDVEASNFGKEICQKTVIGNNSSTEKTSRKRGKRGPYKTGKAAEAKKKKLENKKLVIISQDATSKRNKDDKDLQEEKETAMTVFEGEEEFDADPAIDALFNMAMNEDKGVSYEGNMDLLGFKEEHLNFFNDMYSDLKSLPINSPTQRPCIEAQIPLQTENGGQASIPFSGASMERPQVQPVHSVYPLPFHRPPLFPVRAYPINPFPPPPHQMIFPHPATVPFHPPSTLRPSHDLKPSLESYPKKKVLPSPVKKAQNFPCFPMPKSQLFQKPPVYYVPLDHVGYTKPIGTYKVPAKSKRRSPLQTTKQTSDKNLL